MKTLKILLTLLIISSCSDGNNSNISDITSPKIVVIDGCEYIQYHAYGYKAITHKGNCKYCIERFKTH